MSGSLASSKSKAADLLLRAQVLQRAQHEQILTLIRQTNERAEEVILENDFLGEAELLKALSGIYQTHFVSTEKLARADIPRATVQMIPRRVAETLGVFPVLFDPKTSVLSVVTPDPDHSEMLREVKLVSGAKDVKAFVARPAAVNAAIKKHHGGDARAFEFLERAAVVAYDFGRQVTPEGRLQISRDHGSSSPDLAPPSPPQPPAKVARAIPDEDDEPAPRAPPKKPAKLPPPVPKPAADSVPAPSKRNAAPQISLSVPPPPDGGGAGSARASTGAPATRPSSASMPSATPHGARTSERGAPSALLDDTTIELLTVMVSLLENTRQELRGHSSQVARLLRRIAERMSLDRNETYAVMVAGHIHDLGKMGQFHLTALNCSEYEGHRVAAQKSHDTPLRLLEAVRLPGSIKDAVFHMYERYDGKGFPDKLVGKEIPLGARLLAVADTYADLTQNPRNPFRKVLGPAEAMNVLMQHKSTIFDPGILDLIKSLVLGEDMKAKLLANRYRAIIVDPDPEESTVLELRMVEQGFDVKTARSAEVARKLLGAEGAEFDLVVCEVELPDGDGLAFLSDARKSKWGRDMPWVIHTHKQGRTEAQRAFDLGAMDFVAKPVQADVLVAKLKAMLDQWSNTNKGAKGVSGSLREMGLPDIVQVLFHGRKTGRLNVRSNGKTGEIHFLEGNIANALIEELTGADAFYAMLKFTEGDFALDPSFSPPKRLVEESSEALLLEGMRRMDEGI